MRLRIQPYKMGSRSARDLRTALRTKLIRIRNTRFRPRPGDLVLNWGSGRQLFPDWCYINPPSAVVVASHKLQSFQVLKDAGVNVPEFTTDPAVARGWLFDGCTLVERRLLRGNSGKGVVIWEPNQYDEFIHAPQIKLASKYVPKYDEYRVHVMAGEVIDVQQKRRRRGVETNSKVRNECNGWVFCREEVNCPTVVTDAAIAATAALGLDFGGADIGFTRRGSVATVYEVNTAPGIEGTTLTSYVTGLGEHYGLPTYRQMIRAAIIKVIPSIDYGQDLDDLEQETWAKAWERRDKFDASKAKVQTWLHRQASDVAIKFLREQAAQKRPTLVMRDHAMVPDAGGGMAEVPYYEDNPMAESFGSDAMPPHMPSAEEEVVAQQRADDINSRLDVLGQRERAILDMAYNEDKTAREIADELDLEYDNVRQIMARSRKFVTNR
jgi:RNA polymerase sigma factor (sigma-70 family)